MLVLLRVKHRYPMGKEHMLQLSYVVTVPAVTAVTAATFYPKLSKLIVPEKKTILSCIV